MMTMEIGVDMRKFQGLTRLNDKFFSIVHGIHTIVHLRPGRI